MAGRPAHLIQVLGVIGNNDVDFTNLPALPANTWEQFTVPLSLLGVANISDCNGFWFWPTTSGTTTFYVDAVQLVVPAPFHLSLPNRGLVSGKFIFQLSGQLGLTYRVATSTNLVNWTIISTNTLTSTPVNLTNSLATGFNRQFWRVMVP